MIRALTDARRASTIFIVAILVVYVAMPLVVYQLFLQNEYLVELAGLSAIACISIFIGYSLPIFDGRFRHGAVRFAIDEDSFHVVVWVAFVVFLVITFATADAVPIVSAIRGNVDVNQLSQQRGDFLKSRTGYESVLIYLSTFFTSMLLPFSLAHLFLRKSRYRYLAALLFLGFSVSFLNKSLFLFVALPLVYLAARRRQSASFRLGFLFLGAIALLYAVTVLAFAGQTALDPVQTAQSTASGGFFEASYQPVSIVDFLFWRSVAVPMFTASDALAVFDEVFNRHILWGATSSFFASIFSLERVPFERLVFERQWGWNDIANANSVYITEMYVNFGTIGVALSSLLVGQSFRWFRESRDEAFKAIWAIYALSLFTGGLIPTLLSNGYILMFFFALFTTLKKRQRVSAAGAIEVASFSEQPG